MLEDTIHAIASPPGAAARGVLRVSGPETFAAVAPLCDRALPRQRARLECQLLLPLEDLPELRVPALLLCMPGPGSYTGEDVVELHLPGSPLLLDLCAAALGPRSRPATPGEFTRRAYSHGRLDLCEAEAVAGLIHAAGEEERRFAMQALQGGLSAAVGELRGQIQDVWALLEAGLDFETGETGEVPASLWQPRLQEALARCEALLAGVPESGMQGDLLLWGPANVGKSSLCNALVGEARALVSPRAGTTRDLLVFTLPEGPRLLDGPGDLGAPAGVDAEALGARQRAAAAAAGVLLCQVYAPGVEPLAAPPGLAICARIWTKADLHPGARLPLGDGPAFLVSSSTGQGLAELRAFLCAQVSAGPQGLCARVRTELQSCAARLRAVLDAGAAAAELAALELQDAVAALDRIDGRSSPEDLLDRVFAGFCLGK